MALSKQTQTWITKTQESLASLPTGPEKDRAVALFSELVATLQFEF